MRVELEMSQSWRRGRGRDEGLSRKSLGRRKKVTSPECYQGVEVGVLFFAVVENLRLSLIREIRPRLKSYEICNIHLRS